MTLSTGKCHSQPDTKTRAESGQLTRTEFLFGGPCFIVMLGFVSFPGEGGHLNLTCLLFLAKQRPDEKESLPFAPRSVCANSELEPRIPDSQLPFPSLCCQLQARVEVL